MPRYSDAGVSERHSAVSRPFGIVALLLLLFVSIGYPAFGEQAGPLSAVAPDTRLARYSPGEQVVGVLKIQGSDTMYPLLTRLATEFRRRQPLVAIDVKGGGSAKALADFLRVPAADNLKRGRTGQTFLVSSSRELMSSEMNQFATGHGHNPVGIEEHLDSRSSNLRVTSWDADLRSPAPSFNLQHETFNSFRLIALSAFGMT